MVFGCGIGAAYFAFATSAMDINIAMTLIGIGCAPILMASFYIFAPRNSRPSSSRPLQGLIVGVGTIGNLISSYPMALAVELVGWRVSMMVLSGVSIVIAIGLYFVVKDPAKAGASSTGSLLDILRMPVIWVILPIALVNYMPAAAVRGIWIGPYLRDVFGYDTAQVGIASLVMSIAMIGGRSAVRAAGPDIRDPQVGDRGRDRLDPWMYRGALGVPCGLSHCLDRNDGRPGFFRGNVPCDHGPRQSVLSGPSGEGGA